MHIDAIETLYMDHRLFDVMFREFFESRDPYNQRVILNNLIREIGIYFAAFIFSLLYYVPYSFLNINLLL